MNLADKPYAELVDAAREVNDGALLTGMLKAAKVLPPERTAMMLAAVAVGVLAAVSRCNPLMQRMGLASRVAILAFIEEAKWRSL